MDHLLTLAIGVILAGGGAVLAKQAYSDQDKNVFEALLFALMGVAAGLFLCYVAIAGPPD